MYSDEQQREHIKELQRLLYDISFYDPLIPPISPDGIYDEQTAGAVREFQRIYGMPQTGTINSQTWEKLIEVYNRYYGEILKPDVFRRDYELVPGSAGADIYILQVMLNTIGKRYSNIPFVEMTGIYDAPTEGSVESFRRVSGSNAQSEGVNAELWNDIVSHFNKLII